MWRAVVTQPLDRTCELPQLGELDSDKGEFWLTNVFQIANSGDNLSAFESNRLFFNAGEGKKFFDVSFDSGVNIDSDSRSVVATDFNNDRKPDLLVASVGGGPLRLFQNTVENDNRFIQFDVEAKAGSNIGTRLIIHTETHAIYRDLFPHNGCMGQAPIDRTVGIPAGVKITSISIRWPDGTTQTVSNNLDAESISIQQK